MPVYEYVCASCGSAFDRLRKYAEREHAADCPRCGETSLPVLSAAAVRSAGGRPAQAPRCDSGPACCGGGCGGMN